MVEDAGHSLMSKIRNRKSYINRNDFEMFYLMFRYDLGFRAYKQMNWWPVYDFVATYGHFFTNIMIIVISTNYLVNLYTFLSVALICWTYFSATVQVSRAA